MLARTSVNALIRRFLDEYAAVPAAWREGLPPPWTPDGPMAEVVDPVGAGHRAAAEGRAEADSIAVDAFEAELLWRQG
jgi:hypothetical protein